MNLRGVKESGTIFAIPTYGFIAVVFAMIGWGTMRALTGDVPAAESAPFGIASTHHLAGAAVVLLALRAFSQGCTALTGVEAVSNGVPASQPWRWCRGSASRTTRPSWSAHRPAAQRTAIAQVAGAVFGYDTLFFLLVQGFTAAILILAANTAFNGFPILASILGDNGYLPKQFSPPRRPAGVQQRHHHPGRPGRAADLGV